MKKAVPFSVCILGSSAAMPAHGRNHTAQIITHQQSLYLMDCGEGAQLSILKMGFKLKNLKAIFISHLHGDHYLGLPGLLTTLSMMSRKKPLPIYGPPELGDFLSLVSRLSGGIANYKIDFHPVDVHRHQEIYSDKNLRVSSLPLKHRVPCSGYIFKEAEQDASIIGENLPKGAHFQHIRLLKKGFDVTINGEHIRAEEHTIKPSSPRTYAYCSDTRYLENLAQKIQNVNLLYHEATFLHERLDRAEFTLHTTALEAGLVAKHANAQKLIIGHFSARYKDLTPLLEEARKEFLNTDLAIEKATFEVPFQKDVINTTLKTTNV